MPAPEDRYLTFHGPMRAPQTISLRTALLQMVNSGAKRITVLFSSEGGSTDDGISLYTFLKALPVELTFYAMGNVASIAIPVFLAAEKRFAADGAFFYFHEYSWTHPQATTVSQTTMEEQSLLMRHAMEWSQQIIKANTKLTDKDFETKKMFDHPVLMDAASARTAGIVTDVRQPRMPADTIPLIVT